MVAAVYGFAAIRRDPRKSTFDSYVMFHFTTVGMRILSQNWFVIGRWDLGALRIDIIEWHFRAVVLAMYPTISIAKSVAISVLAISTWLMSG